MNSFAKPLSPAEQKRLVNTLKDGTYDLTEVQHARIAGKKDGLNIVLYQSGKLVVQGKKTGEWIEFVLEPEILRSTLALEAERDSPSPEVDPERVGIDESGKGDFFGPMVIAGFLLTPRLLPLLTDLGVRDSKKMSSDKRMGEVADTLAAKAPAHIDILCLKPETYNNLTQRMGSVNRVLAWGHATVLENLLNRHPTISCAVADQFGPEHQIRNALKTRGREIQLVQRHRAESDPAVAASSILARTTFVRTLRDLGDSVGAPLPKGATHVRPTAEQLVREQGPEVLRKIAKTHFKTTRQVLSACGHPPDLLGTPESKPWKGKR